MLTSDLNSFLKDVLKTDKSFEAGYESSSSEVGIRCKDDGYTYAYNGVGWDDYTVVRNVSRTSDTVDIEADIMNGIDESRLCTIKFSLYTSDNTFGYTLNRDSISKE
jgi:hypothetical protein